jgi:hypothetical protein
MADKRSSVLIAAFVGAVVFICFVLGVRAPAGASQRLPERNTSSHPDCANQPPRSFVATGSFARQGYQIVGGIDANGCDSWPYELAASVGVYRFFFAGSSFHSGQYAYGSARRATIEQHGRMTARSVARALVSSCG